MGRFAANKEKITGMDKNINYKGIFWAGCAFIASGVALSLTLGPVGVGILGVGIAMMAIGLSQRDTWDKD
jgi:hypothetical protein